MPIEGRMENKNEVYTHTMEYYSGLTRKEILSYAATWIYLENIMLSEVGQSQKDKFYMSPLVRGASSSQIHRERK